MVESFDERYAKALIIRKVERATKWCASTILVPNYVWYLDLTKPYLNDFLSPRLSTLRLPAWPSNPDWRSEK